MSSSSDDKKHAVGLRQFKLGALDSSSSSSDDERRSSARGKAKKGFSAGKPGAGGAAQAHARVGSSSSLELSTSSSNSSASSGSPALPAAFHKAAAAFAAAPAVQQHTDACNKSNSGDEKRLVPSPTSQRGGTVSTTAAAAAAAARAPAAVEVAAAGPPKQGDSSPKGVYADKDKTVDSRKSGVAAPALPAVHTVDATDTRGSPVSVSSPTLRSGSDFFFKRRDTTTPLLQSQDSIVATQESSAPAAISKFAVRAGGDDHGGSSSSGGSGSSDKKQIGPVLPKPLSAPVASTAPVRVSAATNAKAEVIGPPAPQIKKLSLQLDSDEDDEEPGGRRETPPTVATAAAPSREATQTVAASSSSSLVGNRRIGASMPPAVSSRSTPDFGQTAALPAATQSNTAVTSAGSTALTSASSALVYNRVSMRGIGSVPASVIEAPSRPRRHALPCEHTMTSTVATGSTAGTENRQGPPVGLPAPSADATTQAESAAKRREGEKHSSCTAEAQPPSATAGAAAKTSAPSQQRPQREAPHVPSMRHLPPPTLLEDDGDRAVTAKAAATSGSPSSMISSAVQADASGSAHPPPLKERLAAEQVRGAALPATSSSSAPPQSTPTTSPYNSSPYISRSTANAALQLQREAALIIYDDRVPPASRTGHHAQPFARVEAPALSKDLVATWMVLNEPIPSLRGHAAVSRATIHSSTVGSGRHAYLQRDGMECRPVLHAGDSRRVFHALRREQERQHQQHDAAKAGNDEDDGEADERGRASPMTSFTSRHGDPHPRWPSFFSFSPRSRSQHAEHRFRATPPHTCSRGGKSHVSDAVVQQLWRQYAPPEMQEAYGGTSTSGCDRSGDAPPPHVMAAGRISQVPPRDTSAMKGKKVKLAHPTSPFKRRKASDVDGVDILNYRSTRSI